eukprot:9386740-Pyramimonas_sp.AAC.1
MAFHDFERSELSEGDLRDPKRPPFRKVARQGVAPACSFGAALLGLAASGRLSLRGIMAHSNGPSHG